AERGGPGGPRTTRPREERIQGTSRLRLRQHELANRSEATTIGCTSMSLIVLPTLGRAGWALILLASIHCLAGEVPKVSDVDGQPLGANAQRVLETLELLGQP